MIFTPEQIEEQIRQILLNCIIKQSKENGILLKDTQLWFLPIVKDNEMICAYQLLNDTKPVKRLTFIDIAGIFNGIMKNLIEPYIANLYEKINEKEGLPIDEIRILIQIDSSKIEKPDISNLQAYLYRKGQKIRLLEVSEFVGNDKEEEEELEENIEEQLENLENETND